MTVLGTAGSQRGLDLIKKEGAHAAFDHTKPEHADEIMKFTGGRGVDVILEMIANVNLATDMKLMAIRGRTVVIGNRGEITVNPRDLMARRASVCGFTLWAVTKRKPPKSMRPSRPDWTNGTLRPIVGKEIPLKDAAIAHQDVLAPGAFGKIALIA